VAGTSEEDETEVGFGTVIVMAVLSLGLLVAGVYARTTVGAERDAFVNQAEVAEATVTHVQRWVSGSEPRTWLYEATVTFTTDADETISGKTAIDEDAFTRLSRAGTAQPTHQLSKRERFEIEPGSASLSVYYSREDPQHFQYDEPEGGRGVRVVGYVMLAFGTLFGLAAVVLVLSLIQEVRQRRRSSVERVGRS
jgi:hypothetical protein